jgi:hypothetical protein
MAAVLAGLTLEQVIQIAASLASAGYSTVRIVDWVEKRKAAGVNPESPLLPQHDADARTLIHEAVLGDSDTAEGFIQGTLGR